MCCSSIYYTSYIFGDWILGRDLVDILTEGNKIYCCQHRKRVLVLVNFQDKVYSITVWLIY